MARKATKRKLMRKQSDKKRRAAWVTAREELHLVCGDQDEETVLGQGHSALTVVDAMTGATVVQRLPTASMRTHRRVAALAAEGKALCSALWQAVEQAEMEDVFFKEQHEGDVSVDEGNAGTGKKGAAQRSTSLALGLMRYRDGKRKRDHGADWGWAKTHQIAPAEADAVLEWLNRFIEQTVETHLRTKRIAKDFAERLAERQSKREVIEQALTVEGASKVHRFFQMAEIIHGATTGFHKDPHDDVPNVLVNLGSAMELQLAGYGTVSMGDATVVLFNNQQISHAVRPAATGSAEERWALTLSAWQQAIK